MHRAFLAIASLALLGGCDAAKKSFDESYDRKFRDSCIASATKGGAPAPAAKQVCDCTMDRINQRFSTTEKMSVPEEKLQPIMNECVKGVVKNNG